MSQPPDPAQLFRQAGAPYTVQRHAIWEALSQRRDHPTADTIYDAVSGGVPGLSRTTVYRTLETLVQIGLATRISHPGAAVRYDPKTTRHHHLICDDCGAVVDLESAQLDALPFPDLDAGGFRVRDFSVSFAGLCTHCGRS